MRVTRHARLIFLFFFHSVFHKRRGVKNCKYGILPRKKRRAFNIHKIRRFKRGYKRLFCKMTFLLQQILCINVKMLTWKICSNTRQNHYDINLSLRWKYIWFLSSFYVTLRHENFKLTFLFRLVEKVLPRFTRAWWLLNNLIKIGFIAAPRAAQILR